MSERTSAASKKNSILQFSVLSGVVRVLDWQAVQLLPGPNARKLRYTEKLNVATRRFSPKGARTRKGLCSLLLSFISMSQLSNLEELQWSSLIVCAD